MAARTNNNLNFKVCNNAKGKEKSYRLSDGGGLYLHVKPNGNKTWEFRYIRASTGRPSIMGLGRFRLVSLAEARAKALELSKLVHAGVDLQLMKAEKKAARDKENAMTVFAVAEKWRDSKANRLKPKTIHDNWRKLELYVFPELGSLPISKLTAPMSINTLRRLEKLGRLETVKRTAQLLNEIMNYAVNYGLIKSNPLVGIRDVFQKPVVTHMAALKPEEISELTKRVATANIQITTRCLIEWQLHTMTRPNEAAGARWDEINLERMVWVIPAKRMKMKQVHEIPLTKQMLAILDAVKPISGHRQFIFPSVRDPKRHTDSETINKALGKMGFKGRTTAHGLRSLASTTLNEHGFESDVIEAALAHQQRNRIRAAYNRTTYLDKRRELMKWWSDYIEINSFGSYSIGQ
ncbi:tyrosine-type recombinase/integrase [Vibrio aestuarianus]|uniref:tyrosine-type recombinase/integrase n=1 Tax=Vibrio aestuarianus TaxID=28171 RepID=UPI00237CE1B8|nr:tyrosine-type recombinase/integrase [Vibrio aestuarianus]MDE1316463.1 tyrosine-type recombinase/integrase [Vibrio aestuarianus]